MSKRRWDRPIGLLGLTAFGVGVITFGSDWGFPVSAALVFAGMAMLWQSERMLDARTEAAGQVGPSSRKWAEEKAG